MDKKIILAVGGTGGHLFPAQALAKKLKEKEHDILFAGGRLGSNPFFHKVRFPFREIQSASPFRSNPLKAGLQLLSGMRESLNLYKEFSPDCIVGFGSFYSFPLLAAARIHKIPYILVESNAHPGKVNRLFSAGAQFSAIQFEEAAKQLKGKTSLAQMPFWAEESPSAHLDAPSARKYFHLDPTRFTLLIFGGSQGAAPLNQVIPFLPKDVQVLHFCGKDSEPTKLQEQYLTLGILACVKRFEERMDIAWRSSDLALCRAGAGTLNEIIAFGVPAILVPWPGATENHQYKNAKVFERQGGAVVLEENAIDQFPKALVQVRERLEEMRSYLQKREIIELEELIHQRIIHI